MRPQRGHTYLQRRERNSQGIERNYEEIKPIISREALQNTRQSERGFLFCQIPVISLFLLSSLGADPSLRHTGAERIKNDGPCGAHGFSRRHHKVSRVLNLDPRAYMLVDLTWPDSVFGKCISFFPSLSLQIFNSPRLHVGCDLGDRGRHPGGPRLWCRHDYVLTQGSKPKNMKDKPRFGKAI